MTSRSPNYFKRNLIISPCCSFLSLSYGLIELLYVYFSSSVASASSDSSPSLPSGSESSGSLGPSPSGGSPPSPAPTGGPEGRPSLGGGGGSGSLSDFLGPVTGPPPPTGQSLVSLSCGGFPISHSACLLT